MRLLVFFAALWLLCLSSCASSTAQKSPNSAWAANTQDGSNNANLALKPIPSPTTAGDTKRANLNQQPQCSKESQFKIVKYEDLPKEVKARIDRTAKNVYSEFLMLTYQRIEKPSAKEPRCQTYYSFNAKTDRDGLDVPKNESAGWTFVRVGERWKYVSWL